MTYLDLLNVNYRWGCFGCHLLDLTSASLTSWTGPLHFSGVGCLLVHFYLNYHLLTDCPQTLDSKLLELALSPALTSLNYTTRLLKTSLVQFGESALISRYLCAKSAGSQNTDVEMSKYGVQMCPFLYTVYNKQQYLRQQSCVWTDSHYWTKAQESPSA